MMNLYYLEGYHENLKNKVKSLITDKKLGNIIKGRYPFAHSIRTDKALYDYVVDMKNSSLKKSDPISKVVFDGKIQDIRQSLGTHTFISRVQGNKLKAKHEIRIASLFKEVPEPFLEMIVAHELAHLKEKEHNKSFYKLCEYMDPDYHQSEFDLRLYLTWKDLFGSLY